MRMTIGLGALSRNGFGQVVVEVERMPQCPQCGEPTSDEGQCLPSFALVENTNENHELVGRAPLVLALQTDCRSCGYYGPGPTLNFIDPFKDKPV